MVRALVFHSLSWTAGLLISFSHTPESFAQSPECCTSVDDVFGPCEPLCEPAHDHCLFGDCGLKSSLAESGINFQADIANYYFGVTEGGVNREFLYGGHSDYVFNLDGEKLLGQKGMFIKLRAEHRWGESIGPSTGVILPPTIMTDLPYPDSEQVYLTNLLFTQFLNERFAVFFGKLDTLDGDMNAFAHGRGVRQFSNTAFVANPIPLRTMPYSTLGLGFVILAEDRPEPMFTFSVLNPTNTANRSGFSELFSEGVSMAAELRVPTEFFEKPGHQLLGATWSSRDYVSLGQDPRVVLPNVPISRTDGSWSVYWNFDQYLHVDANDPTRGWGVFGRAGIADDSANPIAWFLSFGLGGNSSISGREADTMGVGWFYTGTSNKIGPLLTGLLGEIGDGQGVELFYNIAITPNLYLTPDLQVLIPAREQIDPAVVLGLRGVITL